MALPRADEYHQSVEGLNRAKGGERRHGSASFCFLSACLSRDVSPSLLGFKQTAARVPRSVDLDGIVPPALLGLQLADSGLWNFSASMVM